MDKRTRAKFTTLAKRVDEASGTAADLVTAKTDIENLKTSKANIEDLTAAAGRIDVLEAESASVKQLMAGKASVADLTAATGRIDDLEADTASLGQAVAEKASITDLNATNAEVSNLKTDKANITDLNAANAEIDTLKTGKANVTDLTAATGRIDDLEAENASVKELVASKADVKDLTAATGRIDSLETDVANANKLIAEKADVTDLNAATAEIDTLKTGKASVADLNAATAEIDALKTNKASVADLTAATGRIDDLEADTASLGQAVAEKASITDLNATNAEVGNLKTDKADVDLLNVVKATIESLLVRGGIITDSLTGVEINATKFLTGVTIIGDVIKAGTLAANRIILTGENGLIYELNVNAGNLTASQLTEEQYKQALDGSVLVASSITTDKLAAGSVTAQVIASGAVTTDKLEANAVKAKHIDVDDLFAQNITATGTITGAQLIGAILSGDAIDIQAETGNERLRLGTSVNAETNASAISMSVKDTQSNASAEVIVNAVGVTMDGVQLDLLGEWIAIGDANVASETEFYGHVVLPGGNLEDKDYSNTKHTNFSGSVISSGSVVVTKKLGVCYISGSITASKSITDWTTILTSSQVPAPQHGKMIPFNVPAWGSSYTAALRGRIPASGGLQIRLGAAREYVFEISYPIN